MTHDPIRTCARCPHPAVALEEGFVSFGSGARWHREAPRGLERLFWNVFSSGERVDGGLLSSPVVSSVPAGRCPACGTVVVWGGAAA